MDKIPKCKLEEIRQYCTNDGWGIAEKCVDKGFSGAKEHRPDLDRLLKECRERLIDAVVVYQYD